MLTIAWSPVYIYSLPEGHRFPMEKYHLIHDQLLYEGTIELSNLFTPGLLEEEVLLYTHTPEYWEKLKYEKLTKSEIRKMGFPFSPMLVKRERIITEGTRLAALYALKNGISMNIAGGTHHAFADRGEGFCLFNDIAVASRFLLMENMVKKILVVDLDVHQGNGTAKIFENEPRVFTFSMHGASNYPMKKEVSDLDIPLPDKVTDAEYLHVLKETLPSLIQNVQPDIIFYLSGVDVLATDKLGRLALSRNGCKERDHFVFEQCRKNDIPVVVSMGGGYSEKITDIVEAHCNTFRLAQSMFF